MVNVFLLRRIPQHPISRVLIVVLLTVVFIKCREELKIKELTNKVFANPIVTEVKPVSDFYEAEAYHQDIKKIIPINLM
jgi:hypothetical protein